MMGFRLKIIAFALFISFGTFAMPLFGRNIECEQRVRELSLPSRLHAVIDGSKYPEELREAGLWIREPEQLQNLADGVYIFAIDANGHLIISLRVPDPQLTPKYLATHRSLVSKFRSLFEISPKIVSAGEFEVRNGFVSGFSNQSGTFHGNRSHLEYAVKFFRAYGLKISDRIAMIDASVDEKSHLGSDHASARTEAQFKVALAKDPERIKVRDRLIDLFRRWSSRFPREDRPGYLDLNAALKFLNSSGLDGKKRYQALGVLTALDHEGADSLAASYGHWSVEAMKDLEAIIQTGPSQ